MAIRHDYEVSSEGAVRHWEIPKSRLVNNATVTATDPTQVTSRIAGTALTGTVLVLVNDMAVVDFTHSMVYKHKVRNVRTYHSAAEATFGTIAIGDPIYFDASATMPTGAFLSTSPLNVSGGANALFGYRVPANDDDVAATATATVATETIAILQAGGN